MQSVYILQKDIQRLWPELGIYSLLLIIYGWAEPLTWPTSHPSTITGLAVFLLSLLRPLFPLLWLVLIGRLIHGESLVGDRQYWITRPYIRLSLISAKLLFLTVCIMLPFALMQGYLISHAGLSLVPALPGILRNLWSFCVVCWLPFVAIAAVTASLPRMILACIGVLIGFFFFTLIVTLNLAVMHTTPPFLDTVISVCFGIAISSTLLFQYKTRRTKASRIILITILILVGLLHSIAPSNMLFRLRYSPKLSHLTYEPAGVLKREQPSQLNAMYGHYVLTIPVQSMEATTDVHSRPAIYDGVFSSYEVNARDFHYSSPWTWAGFDEEKVSTYIPAGVAESLMGRTASVHLDVVGTRLQPTPAQSFQDADEMSVPGNGRCHLQRVTDHSTLICQYAFSSPPRTIIREEKDANTSGSAQEGSEEHLLRASVSYPIFDPVALSTIQLQPKQISSNLSLISYQPAGDIHLAVEANDIQLGQYLSSGNRP